MLWVAYHGRPVVDTFGNLQNLDPIFRETHFSADKDEAIEITDAIAYEVILEYGQPVVAYLDAE